MGRSRRVPGENKEFVRWKMSYKLRKCNACGKLFLYSDAKDDLIVDFLKNSYCKSCLEDLIMKALLHHYHR